MTTPTVDCACYCDRCTARTKDMYALTATCINCAMPFIAKMRQGDKRPYMVECPRCGVRSGPVWGSLVWDQKVGAS